MKRTIKDEVDLQLTKRDAQAYAENVGLDNPVIIVTVPDCNCNKGLDDSTEILKCPQCGKPGVDEL